MPTAGAAAAAPTPTPAEIVAARQLGIQTYLADAWLEHRRAGEDARLRSLMRSAYFRGRNLRRYDERKGKAPRSATSCACSLGSGWHFVRRACPQGLIAAAHCFGRLRAALGR